MGYVNDINYVNEMNYVNVLSHVNNKNFVNDMSYVKKYELRYELCKLYGYSHESLKIKKLNAFYSISFNIIVYRKHFLENVVKLVFRYYMLLIIYYFFYRNIYR